MTQQNGAIVLDSAKGLPQLCYPGPKVGVLLRMLATLPFLAILLICVLLLMGEALANFLTLQWIGIILFADLTVALAYFFSLSLVRWLHRRRLHQILSGATDPAQLPWIPATIQTVPPLAYRLLSPGMGMHKAFPTDGGPAFMVFLAPEYHGKLPVKGHVLNLVGRDWGLLPWILFGGLQLYVGSATRSRGPLLGHAFLPEK